MYTPEMILEAGANAGIQRHQLNFLIQQLKIRYGSNVSQNSGKPLVKRSCPHCGSTDVVMFTADDEWCRSCDKTFPGA